MSGMYSTIAMYAVRIEILLVLLRDASNAIYLSLRSHPDHRHGVTSGQFFLPLLSSLSRTEKERKRETFNKGPDPV